MSELKDKSMTFHLVANLFFHPIIQIKWCIKDEFDHFDQTIGPCMKYSLWKYLPTSHTYVDTYWTKLNTAAKKQTISEEWER